MSDEQQVQRLLDEVLDTDRPPEEVCARFPELLAEVRKRWQRMQAVDAQLDALFPTPWNNRGVDTPAPGVSAVEMPRIAGYDVEAVLGRGGMGIVYKARHVRLNRPVALKMLLAGENACLEEQERFFREAEAVASLQHANLVQVHDVGDHDGRPYFTMDYIEGGSLAQKLLGAPLPAQQAAALLAILADAIQVAHQGGIVHRDLKPANILLTLDGIPKIADFGLARHFDTGSALTRAGERMGTPSYMAPEQALGKTDMIGPAVDIYSLGALLYELLTGRPPFRGETAAETELQVINQEPVPPSRLNHKVPRDLETICLKCLHKEPRRRYASAADLADDVRRFQRGESIAARPVGLPERFAKWVHRRPAAAALVGASSFFVAIILAGMLWLAVQHAQQRQAVEGDLNEVAGLQERARWAEARIVLDRAAARLGGGGPSDLHRRLDQAQSDLGLVVHLDDIHLKRVGGVEEENLDLGPATADMDYETAFREAGIGNAQDEPASVAARIRASAVREALVAALDDWAVSVTDKARRRWLLEVARLADPDQVDWRSRARNPNAWDDRAALAELAESAPVASPSVQLLLVLAERWHANGADATVFLRRVQREHPADFWANFALANALKYRGSGEAISYFRVALAIRPEAPIVSHDLGDVLRFQGWLDEALEYYRKALVLGPQDAKSQTALASLLEDMGRLDEAIAYFQQAANDDSGNAWAHINLGSALKHAGRLGHYQQALALDPKNRVADQGVRGVLMRLGQGEQVRAVWRQALEAGATEYEAWHGYADLCLFLGQKEEYFRIRHALLGRFGAGADDPLVAERIGQACLLLPATGDELRQAAALIDRAAAAAWSKPDWAYPYFLFAKALAAYRQGRLDDAIADLRGDASFMPGPSPRLVLAMALHGLGRKEESRHTLADAVAAFDWSATQADNPRTWMCHVLRREAETMILPSLPAFMDGKYQPHDNDERFALLGACQSTGRTRATARLYADAFAAAPSLADNPVAGHRYNAARAAAQAGCGHGIDAIVLSPEEKSRWREQARSWLRAELAARARAFNIGQPSASLGARVALTRWRNEPDLVCLRDPGELKKLPADEQKACLALWNDVAAVLSRGQNQPPSL
jgi:serine/threonine-protein kinase